MKAMLLLIMVGGMTLMGCRKKDLISFDLQYNQTVTMPPQPLVGVGYNLTTPDIATNSASAFSAQGINSSVITGIVLKQFSLTITNPVSADFSFLSSIQVFISAPNLPETEVAWYDHIPLGIGNYLLLNTTSTDLQGYLKSDQIKFRVYAVTAKATTENYVINMYSQFTVSANPLVK